MHDSGDHLGRDPWRGPHRPLPAAAGAGIATGTATRPGDHVPLPALPVAAGWARRRGGEILRGWELSADTVETVSLIVSELVTNALQHGVGRAAGPDAAARCAQCGSQVCMTLKDEPDGILIEVFDSSTVPPLPAADPYAPALYGEFDDGLDDFALGSERGRGLTIVANLSEEQGYYLPPGGGKIVWCAVKPEV